MFRQTRLPILVTGSVLLILVGLLVSERWTLGSIGSSWADISAEKSRALKAEVAGSFSEFQGEALQSVRSAAASILNADPDTTSATGRLQLFDMLEKSAISGVTLEYYDRSGSILAWSGPRGSDFVPGNQGTPTSVLLDGPIYSYLVITVPVFVKDTIVGRVVGKRLFTANHPVNNRFISNRALSGSYQSVVEEKTGTRISFHIRRGPGPGTREGLSVVAPELRDAVAESRPPESPLFIPLHDIAGGEIGYVAVPRPDRERHGAEIAALYRKWQNLASLVSLLLMLLFAGSRMRRSLSRRSVTLFSLGAIWVVRYAMIFMDIPTVFIGGDLFDPTLFASSFGYGAARSLGDLFLSAVALTMTVIMLDRLFTERSSQDEAVFVGVSRSRLSLAGSIVVLVLLVGLLGPLSRGLYAIIQSAVFDSRINLNDPKLVFPGPPMAVLLAGIFLLIFSSILGGVTFLRGAVQMIKRLRPGFGLPGVWATILVLTIISSILFDLLHPNPLGTPWARLLMFAGLMILGIVTVGWRERIRGDGVRRFRSFIVVALTAVGLMIPLLDAKVHEYDKTMIETALRDLARPEDAWMNYLIGESLTDMADSVSADVLQHGDGESVDRLAFTAWAKSILAGEGNNCSVTFIDLEGSVVSYFLVGLAPHWSREHHMDEMPRSTRLIGHETRTLRGRVTSWYKGYAPVYAADGSFAGGVWIGASPNGPEKIFGQDVDLLALFPKAETESGVRRVLLAEYNDGRLLSASADDIPFGRRLSESVSTGSVAPEGIWVDDVFDGRSFETFYLPTTQRTVFGVSLESLDFGWHFYSYSRYLIFFFVVLIIVGIGYAILRGLQRGFTGITFRSRLIVAFAIVSILPVVLLAYYNRQSSQGDAADATAAYLMAETEIILGEIQSGMGMSVPYELARFGDEELGDIAAKLKTEFTLYAGSSVQGSSRPELFSAELIDKRLSAGAYRGIYLSNLNFYIEERNIGTLTYLVGYRPIRSQSGGVIGVVSVPALSRQTQVEEILAKDDVLLYGIYILVLGISLVVGSFIANQISQPVRRLTAAAKRVATGDLDVRLDIHRTDELGELESAFQSMTSDLKNVQEKIVRAERELAWKEMARQVAHEIKNPLTPMRLSIQHLVSTYKKGAADFGDLLGSVSATVLEQIETLNRIATEFSGFARFPERRLMVLDLHEVLREAMTLHAQGAVRFIEELTGDPVPVRADREELRRAFINIFRNAIQAAGQVAGGTAQITVSTDVHDGMADVIISDNGPGITPEVQARLFEPNFSTKTDGMGIGLTIVKKTVDGLGGTISITSTPGRGTSVSIRLPVSEVHAG